MSSVLEKITHLSKSGETRETFTFPPPLPHWEFWDEEQIPLVCLVEVIPQKFLTNDSKSHQKILEIEANWHCGFQVIALALACVQNAVVEIWQEIYLPWIKASSRKTMKWLREYLLMNLTFPHGELDEYSKNGEPYFSGLQHHEGSIITWFQFQSHHYVIEWFEKSTIFNKKIVLHQVPFETHSWRFFFWIDWFLIGYFVYLIGPNEGIFQINGRNNLSMSSPKVLEISEKWSLSETKMLVVHYGNWTHDLKLHEWCFNNYLKPLPFWVSLGHTDLIM